MTNTKRWLILLLSLFFISTAQATVNVMRFPSGTPTSVCQPSDSNGNCGGGGGGSWGSITGLITNQVDLINYGNTHYVLTTQPVTSQTTVGTFLFPNIIDSGYITVGNTATISGTVKADNISPNLTSLTNFGNSIKVTGQLYSVGNTNTVSGGNVTINFNTANSQFIQLINAGNTLTLSNAAANAHYTLILKQPVSGAAGTVTFSPVPYWSGGTAPVLTTTNSAQDLVTMFWSSELGKYVASFLPDVK